MGTGHLTTDWLTNQTAPRSWQLQLVYVVRVDQCIWKEEKIDQFEMHLSSSIAEEYAEAILQSNYCFTKHKLNLDKLSTICSFFVGELNTRAQ
jgi:hypothetical protein